MRHFTLSAKSPYARRKSYIRLAAIRQRHGDSDGAANYGRRAAAPPDDFLWDDRYVGDYERLQAGRQGRYEAAERLEAEGRFADSLPILLSLAEDASDARAEIAVGVALMQLNRVEEAERRFRQAVGKPSEQVEANYGLAVALYTEGEQLSRGATAAPETAPPKFAEAVTYADAALKLNPNHAMALLYRGKALGAPGAVRRPSTRSARRCCGGRSWWTPTWDSPKRWRRPTDGRRRSPSTGARRSWPRRTTGGRARRWSACTLPATGANDAGGKRKRPRAGSRRGRDHTKSQGNSVRLTSRCPEVRRR